MMEKEKANIGQKAGTVWHKLNIGVEEATLAVGWLAREDKVFIERKNGILYVHNS